MSPSGWAIMIVSNTSVLAIVGYCLYKVLTLPPPGVEEHLSARPANDTADAD